MRFNKYKCTAVMKQNEYLENKNRYAKTLWYKKRKKKPKKVKTLKIDKLKTPTKQTNKQTNTLSYTFWYINR